MRLKRALYLIISACFIVLVTTACSGSPKWYEGEVYVPDNAQGPTPYPYGGALQPGGQKDKTESNKEEDAEGLELSGTDEPPIAMDLCYCSHNYPDVVSSNYLHYIPAGLECDESVTVCEEKTRGALVVTWNVVNVKSAYVTLNRNEIQPFISQTFIDGKEGKPKGYMDFIGDPKKPYIGKRATSFSYLPLSLLEDPMEMFDSLDSTFKTKIEANSSGVPFNYCLLYAHVGTEDEKDAARCFTEDIPVSDPDKAKMNIFIPLMEGEKEKSGIWLFKTRKNGDEDKDYSSFKMYYKEWATGKIHIKEFSVSGVKD